MKKLIGFGVLLVVMVGLVVGWQPVRDTGARIVKYFSANPDVPSKARVEPNKEDHIKLRGEYISLLRGAEPGKPFDPTARSRAIELMQDQKSREMKAAARQQGKEMPLPLPNWTAIGPSPIPNGGATSASTLAVSGRTTAFAIDPRNSNKVYLGTAQGGVYRSLDGGTNWTQIFDGAYSSAIGALALAPSNSTILYVGTGESNGGISAGVGMYRIDSCDTTATLVGPINPIRNYVNGSGVPVSVPVFNGRSITNIQVHPTDPSIVFAGISYGHMGVGMEWPFGSIYPPSGGILGLVRLTNATGAPGSIAAQKLTVTTTTSGGVYDTPNTGNRTVYGMFLDPSDPNILVVWVDGTTTPGNGGIYRSVNAQAANPAFTQVFATTQNYVRGEFAGYKQGTNPTVIYAATGEGYYGRLRRSTDGGATWPDTDVGSFVTGGYNDRISNDWMSPIAGRPAWTGNSGGYINTTVNLPAAANGQNIRLKWRMATDQGNDGGAGTGVRVDTITGLLCPPTGTPTSIKTSTSSSTSDPCDQNFDSVTAPALPTGWTSAATGSGVLWVTSGTVPDTAPNAAFAPDDADTPGNTELISPVLAVPAGGGSVSFRNNYSTEEWGDGMVLEISINGGPFSDIATPAGSGFCDYQCYYNLGIDVAPGASTATTDDIVGLGAVAPFTKSTNGGATFTQVYEGLHVDNHFIKIDPANSNIIWNGNDGGVFKSTNGGTEWVSKNNSQINTVQFYGLAVHPTVEKWAIGGTQDNGTNMRRADGTWYRVDFNDGGNALVDRNATDDTNITVYHTYFNITNRLIGFARILSSACAYDVSEAGVYGWSQKGIYGGPLDTRPNCDGTDTFNGIPLTDTVMAFAPMELGPGNPNTVYFGAGAVYRSADKGETMVPVSQSTGPPPGSPVTTITVSPQDDNYRIFGRRDGSIFYTTTGSNPMTALAGIPAKYVARAKFDPTDKNTAYIAIGGYFGGTTAAQSHVWKITSLNTTPVVTGINSGLPDVPVNAFAVDPANGNNLFAGTDIGVYNSTDGGATWEPFGTGLPIVPVFGMEIQPTSRILRIATYGRGMWDAPLTSQPQTHAPFDFDGDGKTDAAVYRPSTGDWYLLRSTDGFGAFHFGSPSDIFTPADYTGDRKTDMAVFRPSEGIWYVLRSENYTFYGAGFGTSGDIPAPGDFDGDGKADTVVFRPSNGTWFMNMSTAGFNAVQFGQSGDVPAVADYDGDGKSDICVYRASLGQWFRLNSHDNSFYGLQFGSPGDMIVPADYTGDGKADNAVFRPSSSTWYIYRSEDNSFYGGAFGSPGDLPSPGDYDGDGKTDLAVWRPGTQSYFYIMGSTSGFQVIPWGIAEDRPVANAYVY